jgi:hypothetical protein
MKIWAFEEVDLSLACIQIAETIDISSGCKTTTPGGGAACTPKEPPLLPGDIFDINLAGAEIRNDFGKTGDITITATPLKTPLNHPPVNDKITGAGKINIDSAVIIDAGKKGGGVQPLKVADLNGSLLTVAGSCSPLADTCQGAFTAADHPVHADPAHRTQHNVENANAVICDS